MSKKKNNDTITINKKMLIGIAPLMPLIGVLLSKNRVGTLIVLIIGVSCGVLIGRFSKG